MTSCSNVLDKITIALLYVSVALFILLQRYENTSLLCSLAAVQYYKYLSCVYVVDRKIFHEGH